MFEILLIVCFSGLLISSFSRIGIGNPFQIYFMVWFFVLTGYYFSQEAFFSISNETVFLLFTVKLFSLLLVFVVSTKFRPMHVLHVPKTIILTKSGILLIAQIIVTILLPFMYMKVLQYTEGDSIFTIQG
jgi:hypothetical protein